MNYTFNLLGVFKFSLSGYRLPAWLVMVIGGLLAVVNAVAIAAISFYSIETLFHYHIDFTIETVIAVGLLKMFVFNSSND